MTQVYDEDDAVPGPEPSVESLVRKKYDEAMDLITGGWGSLDPENQRKQFLKDQHLQDQTFKREANLFRDVLWANEQGRQLLEILIDETLRKRTWPIALMSDPHALMAEGIWREAQNSFVHGIIDAIRRAENQKPIERSDL